MQTKKLLVIMLAAALPACAQSWSIQSAATTASLRGVSVVDSKVAWASGSGGTFLRTIDRGRQWRAAVVPGAEGLDFRGIVARSAKAAWMMSSGEGEKSRVYQTLNGGETWKLVLTNPDPKGFFDGIAFWDARRGVVFGDPVDGAFVVFTTGDGGATWKREAGPMAIPREGAFAASNSALIVRRSGSTHEAWFASGGIGAARVFHSSDGGHHWTVATAPVRNDAAGAGIFSLTALPGGRLAAVGGDYGKASDAAHNVALSSDSGATWSEPQSRPRGYRSAVAWLTHAKLLLATGPSGSEVSHDEGLTWTAFDDGAFNAIGVGSHDACWAVGPKGRIARLVISSQ